MRLPGARDTHLTYCLNAHPCGTEAEMETAWFEQAPVVYRRLAGRMPARPPFGLGVWLPAERAAALDEADACRRLRARLEAAGLYVCTINGFPYGTFHGAAVKRNVYRPDWSDPARRAYTGRLARILARLLPEGATGTVSTLPVGYRTWCDEPAREAAREALLSTARFLRELESETGRRIVLALEPEPDCVLETAADALAWFERLFGEDDGARAHLGLCLDTVHAAVMMESPEEMLQRFRDAGVPVPKIQLGAALGARVRNAAEREALAAFAEPVYLHQATVGDGQGVRRYPDLPAALAAEPDGDADWRVHYHVPLAWEGRAGLFAAHEVTPAFLQAAAEAGTLHFETEIYTLSVFPGAADRVAEILAADMEWIWRRLLPTEKESLP